MVEYPSSLLDTEGLSPLPHSAVRMARIPGAMGGLKQAPAALPSLPDGPEAEAEPEGGGGGGGGGGRIPAALDEDLPSRTWTKARTDGVQGSLHQLLRFINASAGIPPESSSCEADRLCGSKDSVRGLAGSAASPAIAQSFRFS